MNSLQDSEDSGILTLKILELELRSQHNGEAEPSASTSAQEDAFDYGALAPLQEGEDTQSLSNFFNLLSKALPIDQVKVMLQQELERRKKSLLSYQSKCNEAEYMQPILAGQEEALHLKRKGISEEIEENNNRLKLISSDYDMSKDEQFSLEKQIEQTRQNVKKLKRKLECCDKIQENLLKLPDAKNHASNSLQNTLNPLKLIPNQIVEDSTDSCQQTNSITSGYISSNSPAKSLSCDNTQLRTSSLDSFSMKNEHSLSDGEILDSDSRDSSGTDSDLDTDDM